MTQKKEADIQSVVEASGNPGLIQYAKRHKQQAILPRMHVVEYII